MIPGFKDKTFYCHKCDTGIFDKPLVLDVGGTPTIWCRGCADKMRATVAAKIEEAKKVEKQREEKTMKYTYTIEEITKYIAEVSDISHGDDAPKLPDEIEALIGVFPDDEDGIAAWKARREKRDEDSEFIRQRAEAYFPDSPNRARYNAIADRLEALQKQRDELYESTCRAIVEIDALQKRVAELEANAGPLSCAKCGEGSQADDWQIREEMARKQAEKQPDADGWIPHKAGDPMPCEPYAKVAYLIYGDDPKSNNTEIAGNLDWNAIGEWSITHWRPAK